jgi:serine/threonine protein kinase
MYTLSIPSCSLVVAFSAFDLENQCIIMDKYERSLEDYMKVEELREPEGYRNLLQVAIDACVCVRGMHAAGVVHADLAPRNFMMKGKQVFACDFGMSEHVGDGAGDVDRGRKSTFTGGRPLSTTAPEVWRNGHVSSHSDAYAFGVLLYELFTLSTVIRV